MIFKCVDCRPTKPHGPYGDMIMVIPSFGGKKALYNEYPNPWGGPAGSDDPDAHASCARF
jgi:hypothetical protein